MGAKVSARRYTDVLSLARAFAVSFQTVPNFGRPFPGVFDGRRGICYGVTMIEAENFGPAMAALNERQRRFVRSFIELGRNGTQDHSLAAREAGYSAESEGALRVTAHRLSHDPRIQAAILEVSRKEVNLAAAVIATPVTISIALNEELSAKDRLRACEMLFNRGGMPAQTEHKVTVEHVDDSRMLEFADRLAAELGVDRARLIGVNVVSREANVIEGTVIEPASDV